MCRYGRGALAALVVIALAAAAPGAEEGDAIRIDGTWHEPVCVEQGENLYYVLFPDSGRVLNVPVADVAPEDLRLTDDRSVRAALRQRWRDARGTPDPPAPAHRTSRHIPHQIDTKERKPSQASSDNPRTPRPQPRPVRLGQANPDPNRTPENGYVHGLRLRDVPLGTALRAALRPLGLDYRNMGSYLFISTPERLRTEPFEPLETRTHRPGSGMESSLPKIVVRTPTGGVTGGR